MKKRCKGSLALAVVLLGLAVISGPASATVSAPITFEAVDRPVGAVESHRSADGSLAADVLQARYLLIDAGALAETLAAAQRDGTQLELSLIPGVSTVVRIRTVEDRTTTLLSASGPTRWRTFVGDSMVNGVASGDAVFTILDRVGLTSDAVMATVTVVGGPEIVIEQLSGLAHGVYLVQPAGPDEDGSASASTSSTAAEVTSPPDPVIGTRVVRVLIVYTEEAKSVANISNRAASDIDNANTTNTESDVEVRFDLAGIREVKYTETNSPVALLKLTDPADGSLDYVHFWREQTGADIVSMYISVTNACGQAKQLPANNTSSAPTAFGVHSPSSGCTDKYTTVHEWGHNLGAQHARPAGDLNPVFDYGYGWFDATAGFRTMMAYDTNCPAGCPRLRRWSNPNKFVWGRPLGSATDDNHRAINSSRGAVSAYRGASSSPFADGPYWYNWNIARGIDAPAAGGGYVLDGWGGIHSRGGAPPPPSAPAPNSPPYWENWDIARSLDSFSGEAAVTLDGWGGVHKWGLNPAIIDTTGFPYTSGVDRFRGVALVAKAGGLTAGGITLDRYGNLFQWGGIAVPTANRPTWTSDLARDLEVTSNGSGGYTLDAYGGVHAWGAAAPVTISAYWLGDDRARSLTLNAAGTGGWVIDRYGALFPFTVQ